MLKPVMHPFHRMAAILKWSQKHKGSSWCSHGVRNSHFKQCQKGEPNQPEMSRTNTKLWSTQLNSFFTVEKRQNSDGNLVEEVQSPKTTPNLLKLINSKNRTLEEDSHFEKTAAICGAQKKKHWTKTVIC